MSAFLGPIHFWLYNKIKNQEELTKRVADLAVNEGWISDTTEYVYDLPDLESSIDVGNIHGWLQSAISYAESRYAQLLKDVLDGHTDRLESIKAAAYAFGKENALASESVAPHAYKAFEDFFVNGMPCDRVNEMTQNTEDVVAWEMKEDIHAAAFEGKTDDYYTIRKSVMDGMLEETNLQLEMADFFHYEIKAK